MEIFEFEAELGKLNQEYEKRVFAGFKAEIRIFLSDFNIKFLFLDGRLDTVILEDKKLMISAVPFFLIKITIDEGYSFEFISENNFALNRPQMFENKDTSVREMIQHLILAFSNFLKDIKRNYEVYQQSPSFLDELQIPENDTFIDINNDSFYQWFGETPQRNFDPYKVVIISSNKNPSERRYIAIRTLKQENNLEPSGYSVIKEKSDSLLTILKEIHKTMTCVQPNE